MFGCRKNLYLYKNEWICQCQLCHSKRCECHRSASFIANNSFAATPLTGWTINNLVGRNLFWVGGGGSWNDAAHWSLTSGGSGGQCIPSPMDNVYFDAKSGFGNFSTSAKRVMLSGERFFCKDMDWTGAINSPILDGQGSLEIYGSLTFIPNMTANYYGSYLFAATSTANIHTANQKLNYVKFDSDSGIWNLTDDLIIDYGDLNMNRGKLITNDKNITLNHGSLYSYSTGTPELVLGKSIINILIGSIIINSTGYKLTPGQSTIILNTASFMYSIFCTPGKTFYNVISKNNVLPLDIHGDNTFNKLTLMAGATFYDNNKFDTLNLTPGRTYKLKAGTTQSITTNGLLNAIGTPGFPIEIISLTAGSTAKIYKQQGKVCLDYLFLKDISAYGGASFYAGQYGANVSNNSGWIFGPCPNPPNITTQPQGVAMCYDYNLTTLVTFSITATNAASYQWQLDDGTGYKTIPNNGAYNGINTSSLSFYPNSISMSGYKYRVIVQGSGTSVTSSDATLTLYPSMSINQFAPATLYVCEGTTPVIGYNVSNASSFQWQMYVSGGWDNLTDSPTFSGTTTSTLTINNVPSQFNLTTFRLSILSQCNAPFTTPGTLLTITSPPAITEQPTDVTLLCGGTASFSIKANSANTYQWQENNGNGFQNISNSTTYSGATTTSLTISNATAQMSGYQYRAVAQGCSPYAISNTANLISSETEKPVFTFCPSDTTIVAGVYSYSTPTATDNCSQVTITQVSGLTSGSIFPTGITKQVFNAIDLSGNIQTCSFNVTATPVISSVTEYDKNAFNIYPNPTTDFINVHFNFNVQDDVDITITDYSGKKIRSSAIENGENEIKIDVRDMPKGMYYLQIHSDQKKTVQMIMIR